jgi:hypothetical protein
VKINDEHRLLGIAPYLRHRHAVCGKAVGTRVTRYMPASAIQFEYASTCGMHWVVAGFPCESHVKPVVAWQ